MKKVFAIIANYAIILGIIAVVCFVVVFIRSPFYLESKEKEISLSFDLDELYYADWSSSDFGRYRIYYQDTTYYESQQELLNEILQRLEGNYVYHRILDLRQSSGGGGNSLTLYNENGVEFDFIRFNNWGELYVATGTTNVYWVYAPVDTQFPTADEFDQIREGVVENGKFTR